MATITVDGKNIEVRDGQSVLAASLEAGIYIPHLCTHPQLGAKSEVKSLGQVFLGGTPRNGQEGLDFEGCNLCLVEINGKIVQSCNISVEHGLNVKTDSSEIKEARKKNLVKILATHPHACIQCPQGDGCDRIGCSSSVPQIERCCGKFGICEVQKISKYVGIGSGLPKYAPIGVPVLEDEPVVRRDYNLCIGCMRCVRVCQEVKGAGALGFVVENGRNLIGSKAPTLKESGCQFCGYCIEVCPTGALTDVLEGTGDKEAAFVPCRNTCPAKTDVPKYIQAIKEGNFEESLNVIYEKLPLPESLGRVCFHPCETTCRRGSIDKPVSICSLKRAATDLNKSVSLNTSVAPDTGKKIAVVGAGPAGMSAAYYLRTLGHAVTIFEALPVTGGMLKVGIPDYRLPGDVLKKEMDLIFSTGIELKLNTRIESVNTLLSDGFDAVFVGVGAHEGVKLGIVGEDSPGVIDGVTFLRKVNLGEDINIGKTVAIIGGGNVASDSARSALRKGADSVTLYYRRTREEMPAYEEEIEAALHEGIKIEYQTAPVRIENKNGSLEMEFIRMEMGEPDATGRRRPVPVEGSEFKLPFDSVIAAIGQKSQIPQGTGIDTSSGKTIKPNPAKGIFVGGDLLTGPSSVIDAIVGGRKGAELIDKYLGGEGNISKTLSSKEAPKLWSGPGGVDTCQARAIMPEADALVRNSDFSEVCLGFNAETAIAEAKRCLGCHLRFNLKSAELPPESWLVWNEENIETVPDTEGIYILYNDQKEITHIFGVMNLKDELLEQLEDGVKAAYFSYEEDPMYTSKERQLIQQYMKQHGCMPPGNEDDDDLF